MPKSDPTVAENSPKSTVPLPRAEWIPLAELKTVDDVEYAQLMSVCTPGENRVSVVGSTVNLHTKPGEVSIEESVTGVVVEIPLVFERDSNAAAVVRSLAHTYPVAGTIWPDVVGKPKATQPVDDVIARLTEG